MRIQNDVANKSNTKRVGEIKKCMSYSEQLL